MFELLKRMFEFISRVFLTKKLVIASPYNETNTVRKSTSLKHMSTTSIDTQAQILDAAEELFAAQGYSGTSLRSIVRAADVNIAAVNYHFGSKEKLFVATVQRIAKPLVQAQIQRLDQAESGDITIESVLRAFFAPALKVICQAPGNRGLVQAKFMGRCRIEPTVQALVEPEFAESQRRFMTALKQVLPQKTEDELKWQLDLVIAILIRVVCSADLPGAMLQGNSPETIETTINHLVRFTSGAMQS